MNNSSFHGMYFSPRYSTRLVASISATMIVIIVLALAGNLLVCLAIALNNRLRKQVTNYFLLSLAVADILTASLHMTFAVDSMLKGFRWSLSETICELYITMYLISVPSSIFSLLAVSVDRYLALSRPLQYRHAGLMTRRRALITIASLWIYSFIYAILPVMGWTSRPHHLIHGVCFYNLTKSYTISSSIINFCVPNIIMCIIYGKIYRIAKAANFRQNARPRLVSNSSFSVSGESCKTSKGTVTSFSELRSPVQKHDSTQICDSRSSSDSATEMQPVLEENVLVVDGQNNLLDTPERSTKKMHNIIPRKVEVFRRSRTTKTARAKLKSAKLLRRSSTRANEKKFYKSNMKAAQTVALIVSCFVVCWMPNTVFSFVIFLCPTCGAPVPIEVGMTLLILTYVSSCINPFLYGFQRRDFRIAFTKILQFRCDMK